MATSKADTISSEKEQAPQNSKELFKKDAFTQAEVKTPVKRDSRIFLLSNDKRQGNVIMNFEEEVFDPITQKTRAMRLIRRAPSIWLDEQPASNWTQKYVEKNEVTVIFQNGRAIVSATDTNLLLALELSNRNIDNKNRTGTKDFYYKEWNPAVENAKAIKEEEQRISAMQLAFSAKYEDMLEHSVYLNIPLVDEQGVPFDSGALKTAYLKYAITNGEINMNHEDGGAYWKDGGFICALPEGRDSVDYLIEFALTFGDSSVAFKNQLEQLSS
jgi:hypothetical protein